MIRWKKRLRGWAGFVGTSRRATARIKKSGQQFRVSIRDGRSWMCAPSVREAMVWVERQLWPPAYEPPYTVRAWFVHADGKVEEHVVEPRLEHYAMRPAPVARMLRAPSSDEAPASVPKQMVTFKGQRWSEEYGDPYRGNYSRVDALAYVEDGADPELVRRVMTRELRQKAHAMGLRL